MNITSTAKPKFLDSPFLVIGKGLEYWRLEEGAPKDVAKEFRKFMKNQNSHEELQRNSGDA